MTDLSPMSAAGTFALLRAAVLSTDESQRILANGAGPSSFVHDAIALAADPSLVRDHGTSPSADRAFRRYVARMGGRATPFGLFAGTAPIGVGRAESPVLSARSEHTMRARINVAVLEAVMADAIGVMDIPDLPLRLHPMLSRDARNYRHPPPGYGGRIVTRAADSLLDLLVDRCQPEATGAKLLQSVLEKRPELPLVQIETFLSELLSSGFLVVSADLLTPGREPADVAIERLTGAGRVAQSTALATLHQTLNAPRSLDRFNYSEFHGAWSVAAQQIPTLRTIAAQDRFHVDLELSLQSGTLSAPLAADLRGALDRLEYAFPTADPLVRFREAFRRFYGDSEVPFLELFDPYSGAVSIFSGRNSALVASAGIEKLSGRTRSSAVDQLALDVLRKWMGTGEPQRIDDLPAQREGTSRSAHVCLIGGAQEGSGALLLSGHRRPPAALMARFAIGRPHLEALINDMLAHTQPPAGSNLMRVELMSSPGGKIGNTLIRHRLCENTLGIPKGAPGDYTLDRILIQLNGDVFHLRDEPSGRELVLELNSAHNFNAPGNDIMYRILASIAHQGPIRWRWGALACLPHLPRVTYRGVVVEPERWQVSGQALRSAITTPDVVTKLRGLLPGLGDRHWVGVGSGDKILPIDLDSAQSIVELLGPVLSRRASVEVRELPHVEDPGVAGPNGRHVAEAIVPLPNSGRARPQPTVVTSRAERNRLWISAKYYCGHEASDAVSLSASDLAHELCMRGAAAQWFFIRYLDHDGYHVRVRVKAARVTDLTAVLTALHRLGQEMINSGMLAKIVMDEYVPEIARYGGPACIKAAEHFFMEDSASVASFLAASPTEEERLFFGIASVMTWCTNFFDETTETLRFLAECRDKRARQVQTDRKRLGRLYRQLRHPLDSYLHNAQPEGCVLEALGEVRARLQGTTGGYHAQVLRSLLHMHFNRLMTQDSRALEYMGYDYSRRKVLELAARTGAKSIAEPE